MALARAVRPTTYGDNLETENYRSIEKICTAIERAAEVNELRDGEKQIIVHLRENSTGKRAKLSGYHLANLLAHGDILPGDYVNGLVISGAEFTSPLVLDGMTVAFPILLRDTLMQDLSQQNLDQRGNTAGDLALSAISARFKGRFEIFDSEIRGRIKIERSAFEKGLFFLNSKIDFKEFKDAQFFIYGNRIRGGLYIASIQSTPPEGTREPQGSLRILGIPVISANNIDELSIQGLAPPTSQNSENVTVFENLIVLRNEIGSFKAFNAKISNLLVVQENRINGSMSFGQVVFPPPMKSCTGADDSCAIVASNTVRDELILINSQSNGFDGLDMQLNDVGGVAQIVLPHEWNGRLDVSGSNFKRILVLKGQKKLPGDASAKNVAASRTLIKLTNTHVANFSWQLPIVDGSAENASNEHQNRWNGTGFRYDYWSGPKDAFATQSNGRDPGAADRESPSWLCGIPMVDGFIDGCPSIEKEDYWRWQHLYEADDPVEKNDALIYLSEYLAKIGKTYHSSTVLEAAKMASYAEMLPVLHYALAIAGYGVFPAIALFWLIVLWAVFGLIYRAYALAFKMVNSPGDLGFWETKFSRYIHPWIVRQLNDWTARHGALIESGYETDTGGFFMFEKEKMPTRFSAWRYSLDAIIPVINLHAYDQYYPYVPTIRVLAGVQHVFGWILVTVLLAALTIL